jgi:pSer/pThr/pTyr-binding forkhead associated (FHA) protein
MNDANPAQLLNDPNKTQMGFGPNVDLNRTLMGTGPNLNVTQTVKPVQCPVCKTYNPAGVIYCVDCGLIFEKALDGDAFGAPAIQLPQLVDENGREQPIRPGENVIGREGDIEVSDGRVSRRHAKISSQDSILTIEDLGSTNGTKVDGVPLAAGEQRTLNGGEKISFGGVEMALQLPTDGSSNATQTVPSNKTAAMIAPPRKQDAPASLVGGDYDFKLKTGMNTFGRRSGNDVVIPDPYVSGKHGIIELASDGIYLTDIGSTNGTMLNDAKLVPNMRTLIGPADTIRLGSLELKVEMPNAEDKSGISEAASNVQNDPEGEK